MAKKSMVAKAKREPKFSTRQHNRCMRCGRPRGYYRKFGPGRKPATRPRYRFDLQTGCASNPGAVATGDSEPDSHGSSRTKGETHYDHDRSHRRHAYACA